MRPVYSLKDSRCSVDETFMDMVDVIARRSTCLRRQIGALVVIDRRILATGYNGAPSGLAHCLDVGCMRDSMKIESGTRAEYCMAVHAEQNCIVQAAIHGESIKGSTLYCSASPCAICMKMLVNVGCKRMVFKDYYPDDLAIKIAEQANVELVKFKIKES